MQSSTSPPPRDWIEGTTEQSTPSDLLQLRDHIHGMNFETPVRLVFTEHGGPVECRLYWGIEHILGPDFDEYRNTAVHQSTYFPPGFVTSVQSSPELVRYVIALAELRCQHSSTDFTLCWLLHERQYALIYNQLFREGEDSDKCFWPKERKGRLPTTDNWCSVALLNGSPFDEDCKVQSTEAKGLLLGMVMSSDTGLQADFGTYRYGNVQQR